MESFVGAAHLLPLGHTLAGVFFRKCTEYQCLNIHTPHYRTLWPLFFKEISADWSERNDLNTTDKSASAAWRQSPTHQNPLFTSRMHTTHHNLPSYATNLHKTCPHLWSCCNSKPIKENIKEKSCPKWKGQKNKLHWVQGAGMLLQIKNTVMKVCSAFFFF